MQIPALILPCLLAVAACQSASRTDRESAPSETAATTDAVTVPKLFPQDDGTTFAEFATSERSTSGSSTSRPGQRAESQLVVWFVLPGQDFSERMRAAIPTSAEVREAVEATGSATVCVNAMAKLSASRILAAWSGGDEWPCVVILDPQRRVLACRPGAQDPAELAALIRTTHAAAAEIEHKRLALGANPADPELACDLGEALLELGNRVEALALLRQAAFEDVPRARHRLARLFALDGGTHEAREWLTGSPDSLPCRVSRGYVLFKAGHFDIAANILAEALRRNAETKGPQLSRYDHGFALLYLGKALHLAERDREAMPVFDLVQEQFVGSSFAASAAHTVHHILNPQDAGRSHGHRHAPGATQVQRPASSGVK